MSSSRITGMSMSLLVIGKWSCGIKITHQGLICREKRPKHQPKGNADMLKIKKNNLHEAKSNYRNVQPKGNADMLQIKKNTSTNDTHLQTNDTLHDFNNSIDRTSIPHAHASTHKLDRATIDNL